ncbi:MAG: hypothetical protein FWF45_02285 [Coriobacteriia bacterium]|nr:hypothetical protein [Coriobacteriia bacterium]
MSNEHDDLITRYIYAVTRYLPEKMRADVEKELDSLIADMLTERCGAITPTEKDIRVVLTELGTPEELAAKYSGDENGALISGGYFILYKRILRFLLPVITAVVAISGAISALVNTKPATNPLILAGQLFGQTIGGAIGGAFWAFAILTIIFAIMQRLHVGLTPQDDFFSRLRPVPQKRAEIKLIVPIVGMFWSAVLLIVFLGFPQIISVWLESGTWIPVFATSVIRSFWPLILLWAILGIAKQTVMLIEGQYSVRVALATLIANILILACTAVVFLSPAIMNPAFLSYLSKLLVGNGSAQLAAWAPHLGVGLFFIICFALVVDTVSTASRALRNKAA